MKLLPGSDNLYVPDNDTHFSTLHKGSTNHYVWQNYQHDRIAEALRHTRNRRVAIDVGAHVGLITRLLAEHFTKVISFEPRRENFECLEANTRDLPNVERWPVALGEFPNEHVHISEGMPGNSGDCGIAMGEVNAAMHALDDMWLEDVDLIKVDVQGYEYYVLQGAAKTIRYNRPVCIIEAEPPDTLTRKFEQSTKAGLKILKRLGGGEVAHIGSDRIWAFPDAGENIPFDKYERAGDYHWQKYEQSLRMVNQAEIIRAHVRSYGGPVLDVGCGDGLLTKLIGAYGIDSSPAAIELAKSHGVECELLSAFEVEQLGKQWGSICLFDVLEHVYDQARLIAILGRVTRMLHILNPEPAAGAETSEYHSREFPATQLAHWMKCQGWECVSDVELRKDEKHTKHLMTFTKNDV